VDNSSSDLNVILLCSGQTSAKPNQPEVTIPLFFPELSFLIKKRPIVFHVTPQTPLFDLDQILFYSSLAFAELFI